MSSRRLLKVSCPLRRSNVSSRSSSLRGDKVRGRTSPRVRLTRIFSREARAVELSGKAANEGTVRTQRRDAPTRPES